MLEWRDAGASIVEISHRGPEFRQVAAEAEADLRSLLSIPDDYAVLFLAGGATTQQALIALNFAAPGQAADYVVTGHWGKTAIKQVQPYVQANIAASSEARRLPHDSRARRLALVEGCGLRPRHRQRNHPWRRVPPGLGRYARYRRRAAVRRLQFQHRLASRWISRSTG